MPAILQADFTGQGTIRVLSASGLFADNLEDAGSFLDSVELVSPDRTASISGSASGPYASGTISASVETFTLPNAVGIIPFIDINLLSSAAGLRTGASVGGDVTWTFAPNNPGEFLYGTWDLGVSGYLAPGDVVRIQLEAFTSQGRESIDRTLTEAGEFEVSIKGQTAPVYYPWAAGPIYGPITENVLYPIVVAGGMTISIYPGEDFGSELFRSAQQRTTIYSATGSMGAIVVPEPAAIYMTAIGVMTCAGVYRLRRRQSSHLEE